MAWLTRLGWQRFGSSSSLHGGLRPLSYPQGDAPLGHFSVTSPASFENVQDKGSPKFMRTQTDLRDDPGVRDNLGKQESRVTALSINTWLNSQGDWGNGKRREDRGLENIFFSFRVKDR